MKRKKKIVLGPREVAILRGICRELTYEEIAAECALGLETVRTHVKRLIVKLGVESKVGLALWAQTHLAGVA